jgi:hypothetical protein
MPRHRRHLAVVTATLGAVGMLTVGMLAGCSGASDQSPVTVVHEATIDTVANLAPPVAADVALTIEHADGTTVQLSIAQIESLRTVSATLHEPFVDQDITFEGVPLRDFFDFIGIPKSVTTLHTVALNEYAVDLPTSIADVEGAILATRADGKLIPVDQGGPTRVVLTDDHPQAKDESLWIWSLQTLSVP